MAITLPALNHPKNCQIKLRPALDWSLKLPDSLLMTGHLTFKEPLKNPLKSIQIQD